MPVGRWIQVTFGLLALATCSTAPTLAASHLSFSGGSYWLASEGEYDALPIAGVRWMHVGSKPVNLFAGLHYLWGTGTRDPFISEWGDVKRLHLQAGIIELGLRGRTENPQPFGFTFGAALQGLRIHEEGDPGNPHNDLQYPYDSTGLAAALFGGPIWRPSSQPVTLGIEGQAVSHLLGEEVNGEPRMVDLSGLVARLYAEWSF
jgi:hypothetical protein